MPATKTLHTGYEPYSYRQDPAVPDFPDDKPIIVFDGFCALCSGWAAFVLKRDADKRYRLVTAQSDLGRALYVHYGLDPEDYETNILIENGLPWFKSAGTLRMVTELGWPWRAIGVLRFLPVSFLDWMYDKFARNRLRWFGKLESCYLPPPDYAERFLS